MQSNLINSILLILFSFSALPVAHAQQAIFLIRHAADMVLVISHTHTIPKLFKELGHYEDVTIQRDEYDNLFVIVAKSKNDLIVLRLRY